jgi:Anaphase-promoting complex subunit 11 RING-H2 finger
VLLPRCRHSFHRECIHPWLTERQGCCPLCKTSVLEKEEARTAQNVDSSSSSSSSDPSTSSSANTRRIRNRDDPSTVAMTTVGELDESEESEELGPCDRRRQDDERLSGP